MYGYYKLTYLWYIIFALTKLTHWKYAVELLPYITYFFKIWVALVLIRISNPFSRIDLNKKVSKSIIFTSAIFIILSTSLTGFFKTIHDTKKITVNELEKRL
jgi:hypothetical protein